MTTSDQELLDSLAKIIPLLTHVQKEKLLSFGEGMACANSGKDFYFPESEEKSRNKPGLCTCNPGLLNLISLNSIFAFPAGG